MGSIHYVNPSTVVAFIVVVVVIVSQDIAPCQAPGRHFLNVDSMNE